MKMPQEHKLTVGIEHEEEVGPRRFEYQAVVHPSTQCIAGKHLKENLQKPDPDCRSRQECIRGRRDTALRVHKRSSVQGSAGRRCCDHHVPDHCRQVADTCSIYLQLGLQLCSQTGWCESRWERRVFERSDLTMHCFREPHNLEYIF